MKLSGAAILVSRGRKVLQAAYLSAAWRRRAMVRVSLSPEMSSFIAARIAGYPVEAPERRRWESPYVAQFSALPLYLGWTETIGIRADGEIVSWSTEDDYAGVRPVEDRLWVLSALVAGVERHPELRELLPERPMNAVDCECRNHPLLASGRVLCGTCGGIGWLKGGRERGRDALVS